ncbi:MAG: division/cell wall cluster transcriptional repressor MraZ [Acidobacteria bacterium]|nr:division/cell wall cluster transcriptional repressor MraZ [Acidobacteriota bacterium]
MFLGCFQHSLDGKGRIILPSKFRPRLSEGCLLTVGHDPCLYVFPADEWRRRTGELGNASLLDPAARHIQEMVFSSAMEEVPDGQGRVRIAEDLRRFAGLEREVMVVGAGPRIEVWDRVAWARHREQVGREFAARTVPIAGIDY